MLPKPRPWNITFEGSPAAFKGDGVAFFRPLRLLKTLRKKTSFHLGSVCMPDMQTQVFIRDLEIGPPVPIHALHGSPHEWNRFSTP